MPLTTTPTTKPRTKIIEHYLASLSPTERDDALGYLRNPEMYEHQALADALSVELGYDVSETTVRRWRKKNLKQPATTHENAGTGGWGLPAL